MTYQSVLNLFTSAMVMYKRRSCGVSTDHQPRWQLQPSSRLRLDIKSFGTRAFCFGATFHGSPYKIIPTCRAPSRFPWHSSRAAAPLLPLLPKELLYDDSLFLCFSVSLFLSLIAGRQCQLTNHMSHQQNFTLAGVHPATKLRKSDGGHGPSGEDVGA